VLLEQLATSVSSRATARVAANLEDVGQLPPELHIALYRIAQESINNVIKHADARNILVSLQLNAGVDLQVRDDGCGFDLSTITPEHQGIQIMRERALRLGINLELSSTIGEGTLVHAHWDGELPNKESA
jgi:signal transduction histidine kinase